MSMPTPETMGQRLAGILRDSLRAFRIGPVGGGRIRSVIYGVTDKGTCVGGMTVDGFIDRAGEILLESDRIYRYGNSTVMETADPDDQRLTTLAVQGRLEPHAASELANLFVISVETEQRVTQSLIPAKMIGALLADDGLSRRLPEIHYYARRPCFDLDFQPCRVGWNADSRILVHGPAIVPIRCAPSTTLDARAIDRLPPFLGGLLREFSWRSDADLVNAVGMLLTGLLINHFVDDPHPGGIVDANQPGTGKTLLVQVFGRVLDDTEPPRTALARDEELEKKLCAQLRSSRSSVFFLDNVRSRIESMVLEQNMLSPLLAFRILGKSATIERPNTYLWFITSNMTAGTPDFIRRCVPIQQFFEGDPKERAFRGNPLEYAAQHRLEILGELAGMVIAWVEQGRRLSTHRHRCKRWAETIGGILDANSLGVFFLANAEAAEAAMDQGLLDLATLAEHVAAKGPADLHAPAGGEVGSKGRPPGHWVSVFAESQLLRDKLAESTTQGKATLVGIFLGSKVNRAVHIETTDGTRRAVLRRREAAAGQKYYYFEISPVEPITLVSEITPAAPAALAAADGTPGVNDHSATTGGPEWV